MYFVTFSQLYYADCWRNWICHVRFSLFILYFQSRQRNTQILFRKVTNYFCWLMQNQSFVTFIRNDASQRPYWLKFFICVKYKTFSRIFGINRINRIYFIFIFLFSYFCVIQNSYILLNLPLYGTHNIFSRDAWEMFIYLIYQREKNVKYIFG